MSSPSSELSWLPSDEIESLWESIEPEEEAKEQQPAWHNKWTPINQLISTASTLPSPPPREQDIGEDDQPSASASHLRHLIVASADRLYETKTARKRKLTSSPPTTRKRRAITTISEDPDNPTSQAQDTKPTVKKPRAPRKPRTTRPQSSDSLLPIRSSKLNVTFSVEKRTASQAFETEMESRPAKNLQTERGGNNSARPFNTVWMAKADAKSNEELKGGSNAKSHSDIENAMPAARKDPEDLFDNDDSCIEEFLEFERTLFAENKSPSPSPVLSESLASMPPRRTNETLEKLPSNTIAKPSPMKPFVRPFIPLPSSQDISPAGSIVSPLHRSPLCFRLADAILYIKNAFFTSPTPSAKMLNLELYAVLTACVDSGIMTTITLADIFFPSKPPYLEATARQAMVAIALSQQDEIPSSSKLGKSKDNLIRAVIQVTPNPTNELTSKTEPAVSPINLLARRYTATVLKIERADWAEIERTKNILDGNSALDSSSGPNTRKTGAAVKK